MAGRRRIFDRAHLLERLATRGPPPPADFYSSAPSTTTPRATRVLPEQRREPGRAVSLRVEAGEDSALTPASHGNTIRNRSIGSLMFFKSAEPNFSNLASRALRICRSTSVETQIPPAPASCSMREAMFTPSPYTSPSRCITSPM